MSIDIAAVGFSLVAGIAQETPQVGRGYSATFSVGFEPRLFDRLGNIDVFVFRRQHHEMGVANQADMGSSHDSLRRPFLKRASLAQAENRNLDSLRTCTLYKGRNLLSGQDSNGVNAA